MHHTHIGTAAWTDLLRMLREEDRKEFLGAPRSRKIGAKLYWYDRHRVGTDVIDRYIGEDTPALREQVACFRSQEEDRNKRERERARLIRVLRAEGYRMSDAKTGPLLTALARQSAFRMGAVLLGHTAFQLYAGELGIRISPALFPSAHDAKNPLSRRLRIGVPDTGHPGIAEALSSLKFTPSAARKNVWHWRQTKHATAIGFVTPCAQRREELPEHATHTMASEVLPYLNYLLAEPISAPLLYRSGSLVQIPRPERFAIYELIRAGEARTDSPDRGRTGLLQARFLIDALSEERPHELSAAFSEARRLGKACCEALERSLSLMPATKSRLDAVS